MDFNIAIDGPAGAGKSTTARIVADKLKMTYVDTGAMYRAITLLTIRHNKTNPEDVIKLASEAKIDFKENRIYLNGEDVTDEIRNLAVTEKVSKIAAIPEVRAALTKLQRQIAKNGGVVMDGRDIGTTVLPDAKYKFYLTASVKERACRRYNELISKGYKVTFKQVEKDIIDRDYQDKKRDFSPMAIADDAIIIDTTGKTIDEVVDEIIGFIKKGEGSVL
ncbi:MAG TPA: (d)CMP kinase [Tepidanaerobacter syntrophicus]|uniref:(d)CMP kinase n=1 Tax=Tepidanaerobacter syntrophicus TaxID=224999 RepID=UPI001777917E|nr:(d)CMP kinase [Tepidanaerobacter syntrophicus]HHV83875.1 (d)CMP kinase [Tepidanaerobacter syntrophicus]